MAVPMTKSAPPRPYFGLLSRLVGSRESSGLPANTAIQFKNGRYEMPSSSRWSSHLNDPYYLLITVPWSGFILIVIFSYFVINSVFAGLFMLGGDCVANASPGSFSDMFFFSVQTLASIGYGAMYPTTLYSNILVSLEAVSSILCIALMTGLAFARFARPTARVTFSNAILVSTYNQKPTLMFRAANRRRNQIIEAQVTLFLMLDETSPEGLFMRRLYPLTLVRRRTPFFSLSWTIMHTIDQGSPLFSETAQTLKAKRAAFIVSLHGIDDTVSQAVHARTTYGTEELVWGARFEDIILTDEEGNRYFDFSKFNDYSPNPA
jgi:inward rectifier potassium channel